MDKLILKALENSLDNRSPGVLCTVVGKNGSTPCRVGAKMWVEPSGAIKGTVGGGDLERRAISMALDMISHGTPHRIMEYRLDPGEPSGDGLICGGATSIFLELLGRKRDVVIFGAGHVGQAVGTIASFCGYNVTFWDDRDGIKIPKDAKIVTSPLEESLPMLDLGPGVSVVICTWGHGKDGDAVKLLDGCSASYIGMLSSKTKAAKLWDRLKDEGVSEDHLSRIHTPIGLSIGAGSPQEIAISIMAEIISEGSGSGSDVCPSVL